MRIHDIRVVEAEGAVELRALVRFDTHWVWGDDPFPLWYRFPAACRNVLARTNGDPLLAFGLAPAMRLGESLVIEAPVSPRLLAALPDTQALLAGWHPELQVVEVGAPARSGPLPAVPDGRRVGQFCSLGVDSLYSLTVNLREHRAGTGRVTDLVHVFGLDLDLWETEVRDQVLENMRQIGERHGAHVLGVSSNLRQVSDRIVDWPRVYHGAALASVGLALGTMFRELTIAATFTYADAIPWGSHPDLDHRWGTEETCFRHHGADAVRIEKLRDILTHPDLLAHLRVCSAAEVGTRYNCGDCNKCVKAMIALDALGALARCHVLPHTVDPNRVRQIRLTEKYQVTDARAILATLRASGRDVSWAAAWSACIAEGEAQWRHA